MSAKPLFWGCKISRGFLLEGSGVNRKCSVVLGKAQPSKDELNRFNFLKLEIYHEFYLFHNGGVQTSKSRCISNNQILLDNFFTPPASGWRALWSSTSIGTTQIALTSAHVLHTLNLPFFSSQFLQLPCESPALH